MKTIVLGFLAALILPAAAHAQFAGDVLSGMMNNVPAASPSHETRNYVKCLAADAKKREYGYAGVELAGEEGRVYNEALGSCQRLSERPESCRVRCE